MAKKLQILDPGSRLFYIYVKPLLKTIIILNEKHLNN